MTQPRWRLAPVVLLLAATTLPTLAQGAAGRSAIIDPAGIFDPQAVDRVQKELVRIERDRGVPVVIETVVSIRDRPISDVNQRRKAINLLAQEKAQAMRIGGIYLLISKKDRLISNVLIPRALAGRLPEGRRESIRDAFTQGFQEGSPDAGLRRGVQVIDEVLSLAQAGSPAGRRAGRAAAPPNPGWGMGSIFMIGIILVGVFLLLRLLGGLFGGRTRGASGPAGPAGPAYPPRSYGGYGGGGGGFFSSLFGGIGGAMAGNWLYDQFSGRSQHHQAPGPLDQGSYGSDSPTSYDAGAGGDDIIGASDNGGMGASWDDAGGGNWGGGGDAGGGGGDWGAGGDW